MMDGLIALPDSLVRLVCRDLSVRDVASLLLTTKELAFLQSDVHQRYFYRCRACRTKVYHKRTQSRSRGSGLSGLSGRFVATSDLVRGDGAAAVRVEEDANSLMSLDTQILQLIDMYFQQQFSIQYIEYNKLERLLSAKTVNKITCGKCGVYLGFKFDLKGVNAREMNFAEQVLSHSRSNVIAEYLALLKRFQGTHFLVDRFLISPSPAPSSSFDLRCTRGECGQILLHSHDLVFRLGPSLGTENLIPRDLDETDDGEDALFAATVTRENVVMGSDRIPLNNSSLLSYSALCCSRCGGLVGWRFLAKDSCADPRQLNYHLRFGLFTSRVMKALAVGDGYVMYENAHLLPTTESDFKKTANDNSVGHLLPTV